MSTGLLLLALFAFSALTYVLARRKVLAAAGGGRLNSLPGYYGSYVALWTGVPALLLLVVLTFAGDQLPGRAYLPGLALVLAVAGALWAYPKVQPSFRARTRVDGWVRAVLMACSGVAILTTLGIVLSLLYESLRFFDAVSPLSFLFGTHWSPQIALRADQAGASGAFGAVPLFAGTFLIMLIAMSVAGPVGLFSAIYLSEYAGRTTRAWVKPAMEILAGVPSVVYGFFAALTVGPALRGTFNAVGAQLVGGPLNGLGLYLSQVQNQMALVAGLVMGIMLIPFVSSLSDDIINSVPQSLRDGSYAMGATKSETVRKVVLPAALPGVAGAFLLGVSAAIGETMIVTMAAGLQPNLTANPLDTVTTVTVQIVTLLTGDQEFDSPKTLAAFGLGLTLFVVTLILNIIALAVVQKYREQYD
ncbi:MAG: phosphate ABC transporter permease subunit PstC [Proteobacteria bacterium]|nr:phosphate ABC transporter permease subunit PstC [Pseudomonadota bacterium]MBW3618084.1 phosphate ABC transporter permease subunit PstC [Pseudomonadota bacterium]